MKKIYISKPDNMRRLDHILTAFFYLAVCVFILFIVGMNAPMIMKSSIFEQVILFFIVCVSVCATLYEVTCWLLAAFNIIVIRDKSIITYIDSRRGHEKSELHDERILSKNKNITIKVVGSLFVQPLTVNGKKKDIRSYIVISTHPSFDGNKFIVSNEQIIMRESPVLLSALKESFECVETEPVVMDVDEIKKYFA